MSKSIAELRANKPSSRPQRTTALCLAPHLIAEVQRLSTEHDNLGLTPTDPEADGPPQRVGGDEKSKRAKQIRARLEELFAEMVEYEGELTLAANLTDGEWRRWTNEHPARAEGEPGHDRDQRVTVGFCDADALIDKLGEFVHSWNSEPITAGDWAEVFEPVVASADKADLAMRVVELYESRLDFRRLRNVLSTNLTRWNGSDSPATSASATSDSTAGSPDKSSAATTATASA